MHEVPSAAYSLRVQFVGVTREASALRRTLADAGMRVEERAAADGFTRQWTISCPNEPALRRTEMQVRSQLGSGLRSLSDQVLALHVGGKIRTRPVRTVRSKEDLALAYTPGAARVAALIERDPERARDLTTMGSTVAVISDGTSVLGLGRLTPTAALPIVEGKAMLYQSLAGLNAVPLVIEVHSTDDFVNSIAAIAGTFAAIHLEDIAAPRCFVIEEGLIDRLTIPVLHDDQHTTAIAVLAGLKNALRVVDKRLDTARIVLAGAGAAGTATVKLLRHAGARDIVVVDRCGVLTRDRVDDYPFHHAELAESTNPRGVRGDLSTAIGQADVFIGLSAPGTLSREMVASMRPDPIVFALANPAPEIDPAEIADIGAVIATGSREHPNQLNNALVFPGLMRGLIEHRVQTLTPGISIAVANALAALAETKLSAAHILPGIFDREIVDVIGAAVEYAHLAGELEQQPAIAR
jgi:malate dehydrogenase (oxaloacetate-decarboxylating)